MNDPSDDIPLSPLTPSEAPRLATLPGTPSRGTLEATPPPPVPDHELFRCIGRGSYGDVWLARNVMGTWRAVKFVYRRSFEDDRPFEREFDGIRRFERISHSHPSQLSLLHIGRNQDASCFYYVMELADDAGGATVESALLRVENAATSGEQGAVNIGAISLNSETYVPKTLKTELRNRGRLPYDECLALASSLVTAVEHLHKHGLVHRDIKPANIIFVHGLPKLADIGLVTDTAASMSFVGTEGYLPPEGLQHPQQADLFAMGKVLYEMATGRDRTEFPSMPPMEKLSPAERQQLQELNAVVLKACDPSHTRRYRTAGEFQRDLLALQAGRSVELQHKVMRRLKKAAFWSGAMALAGLAFAGWQWEHGNFQAKARLKAIRRESTLGEARKLSGDTRRAGWTTMALGKIKDAMAIAPGDEPRDEAAGALIGLEARILWRETNGGSSLRWDKSGKSLLIGGHYDSASELQFSTRLFDLRTRTCSLLTTNPSPGPVAWDQDGLPLQLRAGFDRNTNFLFYAKWPSLFQDSRFVLTNFGRLSSSPFEVQATTADGSLAAIGCSFRSFTGDKRQGLWVFAVPSRKPGTGLNLITHAGSGQLIAYTNLFPSALDFSPDKKLLAMGFSDGRVNVYGVPTLDLVASFDTEDNGITSLAFGRNPLVGSSANSKARWRVAAGDGGGTIFIWEVDKSRLFARLRGSELEVATLSFNPDGTILASGGRHEVRLWDVTNERQLLELPGDLGVNVDYLTALAFSPDGTRLAGCSRHVFEPPCTWVADLSPHRGIRTLYGLTTWIQQICLSDDGHYLAALSHNWRLGVWELPSGRLLHVFSGLEGTLPDNAALAFATNGCLYFCSGKTVRRWEIATGNELDSIEIRPGLADVMQMTPDGRLLLLRREGRRFEEAFTWALRDLLGQEPQTPLYAQSEKSWGAYNTAITSDGKHFVLTGQTAGANSRRQELLVVCDTKAGRELWRTNRLATPNSPGVTFSGDQSALGFYPEGKPLIWLSLTNGAIVSQPPAAPPGSSCCVSNMDDHGLELVRVGPHSDSLHLGMNYPVRGAPYQFSRDQRMLAWGSTRGVVLVAYLEEIKKRLKESGFEW